VGENDSFSGSGGNNDNACGAAEVMVVVAQSKKRCVQNLDYITSRGDRVSTLITTMGIFEKSPEDMFTLTGCIPGQQETTLKERITEIIENCGWTPQISQAICFTTPPAIDEIALLRSFDPKRYLLSD
jgi:acyl CoA:acetate/3-ketoacid CoA transferase beta subunit